MTGRLSLLIALAGAPGPGAGAAADAPVRFVDITANSGVQFVHVNGGTGEKFAPELIGAGGAVLDHDGDGDLDLYFVQGAALPGWKGPSPGNELWENVGFGPLVQGRDAAAAGGAPAFRPPYRRVDGAAGAADTSYGMGCAVADYDNDGDPDLYVTNFGANRLYRNDAGRFTDVTARAGVGDPRWSTSAAFTDVDGDGFADLYVCNYFKYRVEDHGWYGLRKPGYRTHGGPASFEPSEDTLYRNRGDGTFEDVSVSSGIRAVPAAHALGVVAGDFDGDGDQDLYVANDTQANSLFLNDGKGRFTEDAVLAGCAFDGGGKPQAGMGVDAQDANGDGRPDLFVTNFSLEPNTLYLADAPGFWHDASYESGLAAASLPFLGFGTGFLDAESDGDLDLFVANGHIMDNVPLYFDHLTYEQRNQLFLNDGKARFTEAGAEWGEIVTHVAASRGAIFADLDDDGDPDLVVTNVARAPQILLNTGGTAAWLRVQLRGAKSGRDGYGAEVRVTAGGVTQRRTARAAYSYLSSNDPRPLFGLGGAARAETVEVRWPSGAVDRVANVPARRTVLFEEGRGGRVLPDGVGAEPWRVDE